MKTTNYKQNDRLPDYTVNLVQGAGCDAVTAIDLTGCSLKFKMRNKKTRAIKVDATAVIDNPTTSGHVRYLWGTTDLDTAGSYEVEWEITFSDGRKSTVPAGSYDVIVVVDDIS
jgi:hypothetical protein